MQAEAEQQRPHATDGERAGYDVVVAGGGPAGLSAALVLARARRRVAVVDAGEPRNAPAARVRGFLTRDGTPPADLRERGRAEVAGYGVDLVDGRVEDARPVGAPDGPGGPGFLVRVAGGPVLRARRLLVTTGLRDELPPVPGVRERWGREVLHCPYCHGYEVRDQPLGVLGTHPDAVRQALLVREWSADVVLFPHLLDLSAEGRERLAARGVRLAPGAVERLVVEDGRLRGVELAGGRTVPRSAVFVQPRMVPRDELLTRLGCPVDEQGLVRTDPRGFTGVPGVWAAGNAVDRYVQVINAAAQGSAAAMGLHHDLVAEETDRAVAALRSTGDEGAAVAVG
ncbi:NAD(P)/FAD-dependent oxidoreductase [Streptomyces sp. JJ36]|uniref:NAD(P)/FAD-dependent oxidoreductase n=1 Tax=Streptomyces sp. JJ36 TaxID=2736645 RepID=UPI001F3B7B8A|nr:NAD(P)/FAD-dependent oxidoreductase [Streptomyces sp. JJ36]MCF6521954.1 NAD(P)/FAD-dependent oxidoreductase [Streptomyces sp. JJ36]